MTDHDAYLRQVIVHGVRYVALDDMAALLLDLRATAEQHPSLSTADTLSAVVRAIADLAAPQ